MLIYRVSSAAHPLWNGNGAALSGGRWNAVGVPVIYAAASLALAMLERLVQRRGLADSMLVEAHVPDDLEIEDATVDPPSGWRAPDSASAVRFGARWASRRHTALLRVPSAIVPREANYVLNPTHPEARRIVVGEPEPVEWDARMFGVPAPSSRA